MKRKSLALVLMLMALLMAFAPIASVSAAHKAISERGVKHIAYSKNILLWSSNSTKVLSSDGDQDHSGLFVRNKGYTKVKTLSSNSQHAYNYKNEFIAGANLGGQTIGYSKVFNDRITGKKNGKATFKYGI